MIKTAISTLFDPVTNKSSYEMAYDTYKDLYSNNCTMPGVERIIYNIGTKAYPKRDPNTKKRVIDDNGKLVMNKPVKVLTTVVFFDDGSKVSVTNSENDGVKFLETNAIPDDPHSPIVTIATDASKEAGLVYALCKRMYGQLNFSSGKVEGNGFGRKLNDIVHKAYDSTLETAKTAYKQKLSKAKYEASKGTAKPKRPSFANTVLDFSDAVKSLADLLSSLKSESVKA